MAVKYNRPVDSVNVVTVNQNAVAEVLRAIAVCSAAQDMPVEMDGIPSRAPTAEEMAEASSTAPTWEAPQEVEDYLESVSGAADPMAWIRRAQARYSAEMAKANK